MAESDTTYERRVGVDASHGFDFEWQTTNLAYLRCEKLHRQWVQDNTSGVKSYFVANNVDGIGAFDDVVIRVEYPHQKVDKTKIIFVQCKHSANPKNCSLENLLKPATVKKYFDSFIEVLRVLNDNRALSCQTYKEIEIRKKTKKQRTQEKETNAEKEQKLRNIFQCKPQDCEFILYSNMILDAGYEKITQTQQDNDISMNILNTARSNDFNISLNAKQLEYLPNEQFVDARENFEKLKQEFATKFRIIVNQVDNDNVELLKSIIPTADISGISPLLEAEVKSMFQKEPCTAITENSELLENIENFCKLKTAAKNEMENFLRISEHGNLFSNESIEDLQKKFKNEALPKINTSNIELGKLKLKQFVTNEVQETKLLVFIKNKIDFSIWTKARKSRMYRNLEHIFVCLENKSMLFEYAKDTNEVFIEILQKDNDPSRLFAQFSDETSKLILNFPITFQGFTVTVNDICLDEWRRLFDEETCCSILRREEITIGSKFFDPFSCYIERKLQLKEINEDNYENSYQVNQLQIRDKYGKTHTKTLTEDEIIEVKNKKVFLLTGPAGIGKSTTLKSLALKYKNKNPKYFVYFIELNKYLNVLKNNEENRDVSGAIDFLAQKILSLQQLEYKLFVHACTEKKNVAIFFDAFDEISPDCEEKFPSFLEKLLMAQVSNIFVSSRPNFIAKLEEKIKQDSFIFVPFSYDDKINFFLKYYEKLIKKNATINNKGEMNNVISRIIKTMEENTELMAIPLQITMFAEIHFEKFSEMTIHEKMSFSTKMDICSLYNAFIEKLVVRYLVEKKKLNWLNMQDADRAMQIKNSMRGAEELACKLICPHINQKQLADAEYNDAILQMCNQVGLITNIDPPVFLHLSYGEYLAANWFVDCITKTDKNSSSYVTFLCKSILLEDKYREIRQFINALIYTSYSGKNDSVLVNSHVKILRNCGRNKSSLHFAAEENHAEIVKLLLQNDRSKLNDSDFKSYTAIEYACKSGCLKSFDLTLKEIANCLCLQKNRIFSFNRGETDQTPLHFAVAVNNVELISFVFHKDQTLLNKCNLYGETPLFYALNSGQTEAADFLLNKNCEVNKGENPLILAAKIGDVGIIRKIYSLDCSLVNKVGEKYFKGRTPLLCALETSNIDAAKVLLEFNECSLTADLDDKSPLHYAAKYGNVEIINTLIKKNPSLLLELDKNGKSALYYALDSCQTENARTLLSFKEHCDKENFLQNELEKALEIDESFEIGTLILKCNPTLINMRNSVELLPLEISCQSNNIEAVKHLLPLTDSGLFLKGEKNHSILHIAARQGNLKIVRLILEKFPSLLNQRDNNGRTGLHYACLNVKTEVVKLLLTHYNCQIDIDDDELENPFHFASKVCNIELMKMILLRDKTLLNRQNKKGQTPLHLTLGWFKNDDQVYEASNLLLSSNCLPNVEDMNGLTPIHVASKRNKIEVIKLLIKRNGDYLNLQDKKGFTPLHHACQCRSLEAMSVLLNFPDCDINITDNEGKTALNHACEHDYAYESGQQFLLLVQRGRSLLNVTNEKGQTALHWAAIYSDVYVFEFFFRHMEYKANVQDMFGNTPLHSCIDGLADERQKYEIINFLIRHDFSLLSSKNHFGQTPLHIAVTTNKIDLVKILFKHRVDVQIKDHDNCTPLDLALQMSKVEGSSFDENIINFLQNIQ